MAQRVFSRAELKEFDEKKSIKIMIANPIAGYVEFPNES